MSNNQAKSARHKVKVGDPAPDFSLPDQLGKPIHLSDYLGKTALVLYFYPQDNTSGCTRQSCAFRDKYEVFKDAGAEVIGISSDSVESHQQFGAQHQLPFILLSDKDGQVRKRYGVPKKFGLFAGRVTYIIDKQGLVRHIFFDQFHPEQHIIEALQIVQSFRLAG